MDRFASSDLYYGHKFITVNLESAALGATEAAHRQELMEPERRSASLITGYDHDECLVCGYRNPWSWGMRYEQEESAAVCGRFQGNARLQGYQGILHGGVLAALLDSAMAHCLFHRGVQGVTGDLHVRFVQPVSCEATLDVRAHLVSAAAPLYYLKAELLDDGRIMAWAEATFMERSRANGNA